MKKIILAVLMVVMIATPCFAQEVEPEGMFSVEGTLWQALPIGIQILPFPSIWDTNGLQFVFNGTTYAPYIDMLVCSIFWSVECRQMGSCYARYFGILQPIGIGMVVRSGLDAYYIPPPEINQYRINIALLVKTNDNVLPPEFVSISPNKGEQGAILKDVTIRGLNTYIASGNASVVMTPGDVIISNIKPISDTEIKFDLEINEDAGIGTRNVGVSWEGGIGIGRGHVWGPSAFEVLPKTN